MSEDRTSVDGADRELQHNDRSQQVRLKTANGNTQFIKGSEGKSHVRVSRVAKQVALHGNVMAKQFHRERQAWRIGGELRERMLRWFKSGLAH